MGFMGYSVLQSIRVNVLEWSLDQLLIEPSDGKGREGMGWPG